jgi:hypothetical protein
MHSCILCWLRSSCDIITKEQELVLFTTNHTKYND